MTYISVFNWCRCSTEKKNEVTQWWEEKKRKPIKIISYISIQSRKKNWFRHVSRTHFCIGEKKFIFDQENMSRNKDKDWNRLIIVFFWTSNRCIEHLWRRTTIDDVKGTFSLTKRHKVYIQITNFLEGTSNWLIAWIHKGNKQLTITSVFYLSSRWKF